MSDLDWYYADYNGKRGPISFDRLKAILTTIANAENVLVWCETYQDWKLASEVPELRSVLSQCRRLFHRLHRSLQLGKSVGGG